MAAVTIHPTAGAYGQPAVTPTASAAAPPTRTAMPTRTSTGPSRPNSCASPIERVKHPNLRVTLRDTRQWTSCADVRSTDLLGVIGGSGFYTFFGPDARSISLDTPYGAPSAPITVGTVGQH